MKLAIMQPYIFPYIGYFQLINSVEKIVFYDDVNFIKKGWIHRNQILINNSPYLFTIPCRGISQNKLINEIKLDFNLKEKTKFLKKIELAYKKAPFFENVFSLITNFINKTEAENMSDLAINSIKLVCDYLDVSIKFQKSSFIHSDSIGLEKQKRLITICNKERADSYINPIGGVNLYNKEEFKKSNIQLSFLESKPIIYKQLNNIFIPNLSIIDVLMFNSKEKVITYLNQYTLVD